MSNPNITSSPSMATSISVWFRSIPLVTRFVLATCTIILLAEYIIANTIPPVCLIPYKVLWEKEVYRIITPIWFHGGILHIVMNMLALQSLGPSLERNHWGSLQFFYIIWLFDFCCGIIHTFLAGFLFYNPIMQFTEYMFQCNVGFSSILFALLTIQVHQSPNGDRSLFGFVTIPSKIYPWVLLVVLQLIMPGISLLGHLSGILVAYLYSYGLLNYCLLSPSTLNKIEGSRAMSWIITMDGYISNPNLGLPQYSLVSSDSPSIFSRMSSYLPSTSSSSSAPTGSFSGEGRVLGSAPPQQ